MSLEDLFEENPQPADLQIDVRCRHCHHFADSPYYKIAGALTVCSNPRINRQPDDIPCPHFATNMAAYRRLDPPTRELLNQLLAAIGADEGPNKHTAAASRRDAERLADLSTVLRAVANARRAGYAFGEPYRLDDGRSGELVALSRNHLVVEVDGVPYTIKRP